MEFGGGEVDGMDGGVSRSLPRSRFFSPRSFPERRLLIPNCGSQSMLVKLESSSDVMVKDVAAVQGESGRMKGSDLSQIMQWNKQQ